MVLTSCLVLAFAVQARGQKLIEKTDEPRTDQEFIARAISCEVAEVKFAERALKQSSNEDVKKLAQKVIEQHMKMRDMLLEKAKDMKVAVVEGFEKSHRDTFEKLAKLEGKDFDREYLRYLVEDHEKGMKMYEKWAKDARDATLRDIAGRAQLTAKDHLEQARQLSTKLKP
jgi:putative membrane protein